MHIKDGNMTYKSPLVTQQNQGASNPQPDSALHGLVLLAQFHGIAADPIQIAHDFGRSGELFDETTLLLAAKNSD